ncbi:MAG: DUF1330 domain-containing protein [Deltaproteobacteria bacterium]|nr:DUF1330 domain-containing protein [Deltaproteobacteria bacterium]
MPVYVIIDITVVDQELYEEYVARVPAVVEQYRGRYLVRGGEVVALAGGWHPERIVVLEFESIDQAQEYLTSPENLALAPLREKSITSRAVIVQGYEYDL